MVVFKKPLQGNEVAGVSTIVNCGGSSGSQPLSAALSIHCFPIHLHRALSYKRFPPQKLSFGETLQRIFREKKKENMRL